MICLWDSKEILHTLSNYLPHNLYKTWRLARPGAQAVRVFLFTSVMCFTSVFPFYLRGFFFVCVVSFLFALFHFYLRGFFFVCLFSFLFAFFFFVCVVSFFVCSGSLVGHRMSLLFFHKKTKWLTLYFCKEFLCFSYIRSELDAITIKRVIPKV